MANPNDLIGEVASVSEAIRARKEDDELPPPAVSLSERRKAQDSGKRMEALSLRMAGLTYAQIATRLNISEQGAMDLVTRTLERAENLAAREMRELEGARLDRAQAAIWTQVLEGDVKAVESFLRISQRRAKLFGLDAPTAVNVNVGIRMEMEQALDQLQKVVLGKVVNSHYESTAEPERPPALDA